MSTSRPSPSRSQTYGALWRSEQETAAFAEQMAQRLNDFFERNPQASCYITLEGDLGAGKTALVRHFLRSLGVQGRIKSPTYAVLESYQTERFAAWHFDFYRFESPQEWEDAGLRDIFASPGLKLAEWPQKAAALAPAPDLSIQIEVNHQTEERRAILSGHMLKIFEDF